MRNPISSERLVEGSVTLTLTFTLALTLTLTLNRFYLHATVGFKVKSKLKHS